MSSMIATPIAPLAPVEEATFRRGYRAGWIAAPLTIEEILRHDAPAALAASAHSGPLAAWVETDDCTDPPPPPPARIGGTTFGSQ